MLTQKICGKMWLAALLGLLMLCETAGAAPGTILIQGKLTGAAGRPLGGTRVWRVQFYDAPTGGATLGASLAGTAVVFGNGRFAIEVTPPAQVLAASGPVWYELAIDSAEPPDGAIGPSDVFTTRAKVASVLWALGARDADTVDGLHGRNLVTTPTLATGLAGKSNLTHAHLLQNLAGAVTDAQVPNTITIQRAANADRATTAGFASNADRLDGQHAAAFAGTAHNHELDELNGEVTDAQVPDTITILHAADADRSLTATLALRALVADRATSATYADRATTATVALTSLAATDADTVDGKHAAQLANAAHTHDAAQIVSGQLTDPFVSDILTINPGGSVDGGAIKSGTVLDARIDPNLTRDAEVMTRVLAGDGHGSGLDADLLDGQDGAAYATDGELAAGLATKSDTTHNHALNTLTGAVTDAQVPNNITITEADTLATVTGRGATSGQIVSLTNTTNAFSPATGALRVSGGAGVARDLHVGGQLYLNGRPAFGWMNITEDTQAAANTGYVTSHSALLNVTLPTNPSIGDVVRVHGGGGGGGGGWAIKQNIGQRILLDPLNVPEYRMAEQRNGPEDYQAIAGTADSRKLAACTANQMLLSGDYGVHWTGSGPVGTWTGAACSEGGDVLAACQSAGFIYTTTDWGVTWTPRLNDAPRDWRALACSADGTRMLAANYNGHLYFSYTSGASWEERMTDADRDWSRVAMSASGEFMAACDELENLYVSSTFGSTWTPVLSTSTMWIGLAMSANGRCLLATSNPGYIHLSRDGGQTWVTRMADMERGWSAAAMSADGNIMTVGLYQEMLYFSTDAGATWKNGGATLINWFGLAMARDGSLITATAYNQGIYQYRGTFKDRTSADTFGFLTGGPNSSVELQYLGGGIFSPVSAVGPLGAN